MSAALTLQRIERYAIEKNVHGTVLRMRQGRRALGVAFLSLAVLLASWWFGPFGPQPASGWALSDPFYWIWCSFFSLVLVMGLLGALCREDWTITAQDIVVTKSIGPWRSTRRVPRARSLGIRLEIITGGDHGPVFPYRLRFLDAQRRDSGLRIELQLIGSVDRFLHALRSVLTLDLDDPRSRRTA